MLAVDDGNAYPAAGLAGLGVLWLPDYMAKSHLERGELVPLFEDWQVEPMLLYVASLPNRHVSAVAGVHDWVVEVVGAGRRLGSRHLQVQCCFAITRRGNLWAFTSGKGIAVLLRTFFFAFCLDRAVHFDPALPEMGQEIGKGRAVFKSPVLYPPALSY